jgi:hypothetical protein
MYCVSLLARPDVGIVIFGVWDFLDDDVPRSDTWRAIRNGAERTGFVWLKSTG